MLEDYAIDFQAEVGRGTFGIVFEARLKVPGPKCYCAKLFTTSKGSANEIEILKHISSYSNLRNIVAVFATGTIGIKNRPCIIFEKLDGGEVFESIVSQGRFSERKAAMVLMELMTGLFDLHRIAGVLHRDIKPENLVFVNQTDSSPIKLIDFGLAIRLPLDEIDNGITVVAKIPTGTQGYISPETLSIGKYSSKSDVWAAGEK